MHVFHSIQQQLHVVDSDSDDGGHAEELASLSQAVQQLQAVQGGLQAALTASRCIAAIEDMHSTASSSPAALPSSKSSQLACVSVAAAAAAVARMRVYPPFATLDTARAELVEEGCALLRTASAGSSPASSPSSKGGQGGASGAADGAADGDFTLHSAESQAASGMQDLAALAVRVLKQCAALHRTHAASAGAAEKRQAAASPHSGGDQSAAAASPEDTRRSMVRQRLHGALQQRAAPSVRRGGGQALQHMELMGGGGVSAGGVLAGQPLGASSDDDEGVDDDMVSMSSALKEASQAMADRLRADNAVLDSATQAAGNNLSSISATQAELSAENQGATVTFISTLFLLAGVVCVFVATYAAIRFLPK